MARRHWLAVGALVIEAGCASLQTRLYPVCFYNDAPAASVIEGKYLPQLMSVMRMQARHDTAVHVEATPDARWIVARTTEAENTRLATLWPRVGCIGTATSGSTVRQEKDCVSYLNDFITRQQYLQFGSYRVLDVEYPNESPIPNTAVFCGVKAS